MSKIYLFPLAALISFIIHAQEQRALVIGIDKYAPPPGAIISTQSDSLGLNVENELKKLNGNVKVKITKLVGANRSKGEIIEGKITDIKPGELFEVTNWVTSAAPYLKLYIPEYV